MRETINSYMQENGREAEARRDVMPELSKRVGRDGIVVNGTETGVEPTRRDLGGIDSGAPTQFTGCEMGVEAVWLIRAIRIG